MRDWNWKIDLFRDWSPPMAYILGFIFADGCIVDPKKSGAYGVRISQKHPEILRRIQWWINEEGKIYKEKRDGIYVLAFWHRDLPEVLSGYGLHPRKSLTMQWPNPPGDYLGPFVRGYFDGDGCVSNRFDGGKRLGVIFTSGAEGFLKGLAQRLAEEGMNLRRPSQRNRNLWALYYTSKFDVKKLYLLMYRNCSGGLFLERKRGIFEKSAVIQSMVRRA